MVGTVINLKQIKFDDSVSPLFKGDELELSSKNFIFAKNGSGKSTLSLILAGISQIDEGTMDINGEQALIAINTGLDMQLTGLENINVKGALLGLSRKRIQEITEGVIEFAEIGDFLYHHGILFYWKQMLFFWVFVIVIFTIGSMMMYKFKHKFIDMI